jgi:hypothetical protein
MLLSGPLLKETLEKGITDENGVMIIKPKFIRHDTTITHYAPYDYIYGPYHSRCADYFVKASSNNSILSPEVKLKLIYYLIKSPFSLA